MNRNDRTECHIFAKSPVKRRLGFKQIIPGRYPSTAFIKVLPHMLQNPQSRNVVLRQGIPDAQCEYIFLKDVCKLPKTENIPFQMACNNVKITENLWRQFGVDLQQGIPDPYRFEGLIQCEKCFESYKEIDKPTEEQVSAEKSSSKFQKSRENIKKTKKHGSDLEKHAKKYKNIYKERNKQRIENEEKTLDKLNETKAIKTASYSQRLHPFSDLKVRGHVNQTQSKITRMIKGIVKKCKKTMWNISSSHSNYFNVNFVCHRCKCPYFSICGIRQCSSAERFLRRIPSKSSEDSHDSQSPDNSQKPSEKTSRGNINRDSKKNEKSSRNEKHKKKLEKNAEKHVESKGRKDDTYHVASSKESHVLSGNELLLLEDSSMNSNSTTCNSAIGVINDRKIHRENIPLEEISRSSSKCKSSSDRLKQYIYDCFPPVLEPVSSENHSRNSSGSYVGKTEDFVMEDVKSFSNNSEDSSLRTKSSQILKSDRPFRFEEIFDEQSSENKLAKASIRYDERRIPQENSSFVIQGIPEANKKVPQFPTFINPIGKFGFIDINQIDDSRNVDTLYEGIIIGAIDKTSYMNDLLLESYREHVSSNGK